MEDAPTREVYISFLTLKRLPRDDGETDPFIERQIQKLTRFSHVDLVIKTGCRGDPALCAWTVRDEDEAKDRLERKADLGLYRDRGDHPAHFHYVASSMLEYGFTFWLDRNWDEKPRLSFSRKYTTIQIPNVTEQQYQNIKAYILQCRKDRPKYNSSGKCWITASHTGAICRAHEENSACCGLIGRCVNGLSRLCYMTCCCGWIQTWRRRRAAARGDPSAIATNMERDATCPSYIIGAMTAAGGFEVFDSLNQDNSSPDDIFDACMQSNFKVFRPDVIRNRLDDVSHIYDLQGRLVYPYN